MVAVLPMHNPAATLTPAQVFVRLACRSCGMAVLQASGVYLIAHGSLWAGATGFLISLNWIAASRAGNDHRLRGSAIAYGVGGGIGSLVVVLVARYL